MFNKLFKNDDEELKSYLKSLTERIDKLEKSKKVDIVEPVQKKRKRRKISLKDIVRGIEFNKSEYSLQEFARISGVSETTVRQMIKDHRLKADKINDKWIIKIEDLPIQKNSKEIPKETQEDKYEELKEIILNRYNRAIDYMSTHENDSAINYSYYKGYKTALSDLIDYYTEFKEKKTNEEYKNEYWEKVNNAIDSSNDICDFVSLMLRTTDTNFGIKAFDNLIEWGKLKKFGSKELLKRNENNIFNYGELTKNIDIAYIEKPTLE